MAPSDDHLAGIVVLGPLDVAGYLVEGPLVDDGGHEVREVPGIAHLDLGDLRAQVVPYRTPHG